MLLKGGLVKLKYSFQGPIQTDENYMPLLTLSVKLWDIFAKFFLQVLQRRQAKYLFHQHAFKWVSCQINIYFPRPLEI